MASCCREAGKSRLKKSFFWLSAACHAMGTFANCPFIIRICSLSWKARYNYAISRCIIVNGNVIKEDIPKSSRPRTQPSGAEAAPRPGPGIAGYRIEKHV